MKILYRDVEKILDTRMSISVQQQHPVIPILEKEADTIPLDFHPSGRDSHIDLFICADAAQKLKGILSQFNPRNRGDCLMVRIRADEMRTASTILEETATVKTAVRGGLYLKGDNIFADYRFHSSSSADVTEIGRKIISMKNRTRISDLGPTHGGISALDSVNGRIRLGVVTYEADILDGTGLPSGGDCYIEYTSPVGRRMVSGLSSIREVNSPSGTSDHHSWMTCRGYPRRGGYRRLPFSHGPWRAGTGHPLSCLSR